MKYQLILKPVYTLIDPSNVYEHTPLDPWISEYPRFLRPVSNNCQVEMVRMYEDAVKTAKRKAP